MHPNNLSLLLSIVWTSNLAPQSVMLLLGLPDGYDYKEKAAGVGDVAAKAEARMMIEESTVEDVVPVDFEKKVLVESSR